eukprot:SAG31_NODE_492_length_14913_cov_4.109086_2_plen_90_part_00
MPAVGTTPPRSASLSLQLQLAEIQHRDMHSAANGGRVLAAGSRGSDAPGILQTAFRAGQVGNVDASAYAPHRRDGPPAIAQQHLDSTHM